MPACVTPALVCQVDPTVDGGGDIPCWDLKSWRIPVQTRYILEVYGNRVSDTDKQHTTITMTLLIS